MIMEELIFKYLSKELSQEEWTQLKSWLDENPNNRKSLNQLHSYVASTDEPTTKFKGELWSEIQSKYDSKERATVPQSDKSYIHYFIRIAAVLCIAATLSLVIYHSLFTVEEDGALALVPTIEKTAPWGSKLTTRLPDGSIVTLNSGSKISFPENFSETNREVQLVGEAFFEVQRNEHKPFYVAFNNDLVEVLGTSFNINAYKPEKTISVAVATGKVSYSVSSIDSEMILEKGEMAVYNHGLKQLAKQEFDAKEIYGWKDKVLYFKNKSFEEIIPELEKWYGITIVSSGDFADKGTFSGEFNNKPLKEVLKGLSYLYEFTYDIEENMLIIK